MRKYETLLLFSPELTSETRQEIVDNLTGVISKGDGAIQEIDDWGMRELAYPVKKQIRGHYTRLVFDAPGALVGELERNIRITDGIFKFVTVNLGENGQIKEA